MRPRRYYQYVEKGHTPISGLWRVLHVFCFIGIIVSSMVGAKAFCEIFDIFNYRCVLYAKVSTKLTDIEYKNESSSTILVSIDSEKIEDLETNVNEPKLQELRGFPLNLGIFEDDYDIEVGAKHTNRKIDFSNAVPVPGVQDIYIYNDELWFKNDTMIARAHVVMTTTVFATLLMCDFVIFTPFLSLIVAAIFTLIVLMFSRTDRMAIDLVPAAWIYVYPLIIAAGTMTVLTVAAFNLVFSGFNAFCARFVHLTGKKVCSPLMDYFTKEQKLGRRDLFWNIRVSKINYLLSLIFWIAQLLVTLTRLLCAADFQMTSTLIRQKTQYDNGDEYDEEDLLEFGQQLDFDEGSEIRLIDVINKLKKQPKKE